MRYVVPSTRVQAITRPPVPIHTTYFLIGHGACIECLERWLEDNPKKTCAVCREPHTHKNLRRIFIDWELAENPLIIRTNEVAKKIGEMGPDSPLKSIQRTPHEIAKLARIAARQLDVKKAEVSGRYSFSSSNLTFLTFLSSKSTLWDAKEDFETRLAPMFEELEELRKENESLKQANADLRVQSTLAQNKAAKYAQRLEGANRAAAEAAASSTKLNERNATIQHLTEENSALEANNKQYRDQLEKLKKSVRCMNLMRRIAAQRSAANVYGRNKDYIQSFVPWKSNARPMRRGGANRRTVLKGNLSPKMRASS